ncbi:MAG: hypothetical protein ABL995_11420 [Bryobacteraceae bacterium]
MKRLIFTTLFLPVLVLAQDGNKPISVGGFDNTGSATFGYRFTDISGYEPKFDELFNLRSGPRLLDFNLFGTAQEGKNKFADNYSLTTSGIGGDPFMTTQFNIRKAKRYDLRTNFRQSRYYWNRNDSAAVPSGVANLTSNHDWATVRKLGSINLLIHATNNLRFNFEYYRNTRDGVQFTTRPVDFFGSPSTWGGFARANPFYLVSPVDESANRVTGGVDYTLKSWNLHYKLGYQRFTNIANLTNPVSPERSINTADATAAKELLTAVTWADSRKLSTPVSEFSYNGKVSSRLEARGAYLFYRYKGPATLAMTATGSARGSSTSVINPYTVSLNSNADVSEPNHVIDQGFTYKATEWWNIIGDYRYSRFTVDSAGDFRSVLNGVTTTGDALNQWKIGAHTADLNMTFTPVAALLVRGGVRYMKTDVVMLQDGVVDLARTKRIKTVWPVLSAYYQPSKMLTVRADIDQVNNGTSYTRVSPHIDKGGRVVIRFKPIERVYLENATIVRNRELLTTDYHNTIRSNASTLNFDVTQKLAVYAGFSYDSYYAANYVNFLRGPAGSPFTNIALRDQTVDRVWSGGIRTTPVKNLGINFTGNYVRVTGVGEIAGEAPMYGPMSFPYATGSIFYDFPKLGRLTAQLQRTYYIEQIVPGNNFGAKILTLAWTKSF